MHLGFVLHFCTTLTIGSKVLTRLLIMLLSSSVKSAVWICFRDETGWLEVGWFGQWGAGLAVVLDANADGADADIWRPMPDGHGNGCDGWLYKQSTGALTVGKPTGEGTP
jgi:hypothetical protein